jgi:hypothetical protein
MRLSLCMLGILGVGFCVMAFWIVRAPLLQELCSQWSCPQPTCTCTCDGDTAYLEVEPE